MKLYVCWGVFAHPFGHVHPCRRAYVALREAGYDPQLIRGYGLRQLSDTPFNLSSGRRTAKSLNGDCAVPVMIADDGTVVADSARISDWARVNPAAHSTARP